MFWAPCGSGVGGTGGWGWGVVGGVPHTCAYACACTHAHAHIRAHGKHDNFMQMAASIGFLGNPWEYPMMSYMCACMCMHACMCVCMCVGATSHQPPSPSTHPPAPGGDLRNQNSIVLELIKIFQFCLKILNLCRLPHPWVGV